MGGHVPDFGTISIYSEKRNSVIHNASPWTKLFFLFLTILSAVIIQNFLVLITILVGSVTVYAIGKLPLRRLFNWWLIPSFFVVVIAALFIFSEPGHVLGCVSFLGYTITISDMGILLLAKMLVRTLSIITLTFTIIMSTKYAHISSIVKTLLPSPLNNIFLLSYRFSFVVFEAVSDILKAIHSRGGGLVKGFTKQSRLYGNIVATSLIYSIEKAERIGNAMAARGFSGKIVVHERAPLPSISGIAVMVGTILILSLLFLGGYLL